MTSRRKVILTTGTLAALALSALVVLPFLFKDRIAARARAEIQAAVRAEVDWGRVGLTFFRDFPNVTLSLDDLSVVGVDRFAGDTLVAMGGFRLALDVGSVVRSVRGTGPLLVRSILLDAPRVTLKVLEDGAANWDILAADPDAAAPAAETSKALSIELRSLDVSHGNLVFDNAQTGLHASVAGLEHTLNGDFSRERFTLETRTRTEATSLRFAGMPYLDRVAVDFRADVDADMRARRFTFVDNELRLNDLVVAFAGTAADAGDRTALDVTFQAPRTEFSQVLSLLQVVYANDFESLETAGSFTLQGHLRGEWAEGVLPAFALNAKVDDGMFKYPDLPLPAREISMDLAVENPGGDVDGTVVRLAAFHVRLGDQPVDAAMTLRTPVSDPDLDLSVKGTVDLADVARTLKVEGVDELSGVVSADAAVRARLSDIDGARWDRVLARGNVSASQVAVRSSSVPYPVSVAEGTLVFTPQRAEIRSLQAQVGNSDVQATGSLDNLLGFVLKGEELRGRASFSSRNVDLDEWKSDDSSLQLIPVPGGVDLALNGTVDRMTFGALVMSNARGGLRVRDRRVTLDDFSLGTLGGRVAVNGFYETTDPARPTFAVALVLDSLDIPQASGALLTVRMLAPVARFARGAFTARMDLAGALGGDDQGVMVPLFDALDGGGSLFTTSLALEGFPAMARLAEALSLPQLANPTFQAIRSTVEIRGGRLHVRPFQVGMGDFRLGVAGSNGVDQSLDYQLSLAVPRAMLGAGADQAVRGLIAKATQAGVDVQAADTLQVRVGLGGTVTAPSIRTDFGGVAANAGAQVRQAAGEAVEQRLDAAQERVDSAAEGARRQAQAAADSLVQQAEERAAEVRAEARRLADELRAEANRRADQVMAEATNPVARVAAKAVADRIRKEADDKATAGVAEADRRADALVAEARTRADALLKGGGE
jgi:hypothetical protein